MGSECEVAHPEAARAARAATLAAQPEAQQWTLDEGYFRLNKANQTNWTKTLGATPQMTSQR